MIENEHDPFFIIVTLFLFSPCFLLCPPPPPPQDIQVIHDRCSDPSLAVRKQAIACLTTILLERRENAEVQRSVCLLAWIAE